MPVNVRVWRPSLSSRAHLYAVSSAHQAAAMAAEVALEAHLVAQKAAMAQPACTKEAETVWMQVQLRFTYMQIVLKVPSLVEDDVDMAGTQK